MNLCVLNANRGDRGERKCKLDIYKLSAPELSSFSPYSVSTNRNSKHEKALPIRQFKTRHELAIGNALFEPEMTLRKDYLIRRELFFKVSYR